MTLFGPFWHFPGAGPLRFMAQKARKPPGGAQKGVFLTLFFGVILAKVVLNCSTRSQKLKVKVIPKRQNCGYPRKPCFGGTPPGTPY